MRPLRIEGGLVGQEAIRTLPVRRPVARTAADEGATTHLEEVGAVVEPLVAQAQEVAHRLGRDLGPQPEGHGADVLPIDLDLQDDVVAQEVLVGNRLAVLEVELRSARRRPSALPGSDRRGRRAGTAHGGAGRRSRPTRSAVRTGDGGGGTVAAGAGGKDGRCQQRREDDEAVGSHFKRLITCQPKGEVSGS